ncbi:hypothetical protein GGI43DRAFT_407678 [Trichoderma evansii]
MHPSHKGPYGTDGHEKRGIDFLEFAAPRILQNGKLELVYTFDELPPPQTEEERAKMQNWPPSDEILMTKHGHSAFINTLLEHLLNKRGIKTLLIAGMQTDGAARRPFAWLTTSRLLGNGVAEETLPMRQNQPFGPMEDRCL